MGRAVGQDRQDELDLLTTQRAKIHADGIIVPLVNLMPLAESLNGITTNLILKFKNHIAVIGFI